MQINKEAQSERTASPPPPAPARRDGGPFAWLQCVGAFFLFFNSWGLVNAWGTYQAYYEQHFLRATPSSSIAWIGSLQAFLFIFGGVVTGPLYDRGYLQVLLRMGSFLVVLGMILTSLCDQLWQVILAQGLVVGLGNAMFFVPSMALLPTYFVKRRALSTGVAITGGNVGGIVYSLVFERLLPAIGFAWTTRVLAFIMLSTLVLPMACLKMRLKPATARKTFDIQPWTERAFVVFAIACFFGLWGLYIPYFYIDSFALANRLANPELAPYLLPIINAGSFAGRIILCYTADLIGPVTLLLVCACASGILGFVWAAVTTQAGLVAFCVWYGCFSGTYLSLVMTIVATVLSPNMQTVGLRIGMACIPCALGFLIGSPVAGASMHGGIWVGPQVVTGAMLILSTLSIAILRVIKVGWQPFTQC